MNVEKYSKDRFADLGLNTPAGRRLAEELRVEVYNLIQPAVSTAFSDVIEQLRTQGHNLCDHSSAGNISFRDEAIKDQCGLRLGCEVVISAGYGHDSEVSQTIKDSVSQKLQKTWKLYIDAVHRFITLNTSVIVGVAAVVSFVPTLHKAGDATKTITSRLPLFWGLVLLLVCLLCLVIVRIWVQQFMDYEVMQPREDVDKYFQGRIHYSQSYRLSERSYRWQYYTVRGITIFAPLSFLAGLSLSLFFLYQNLQ